MKTNRKSKHGRFFSDADRVNLRWLWTTYCRRRMKTILLVLGMIVVQGLVYQQFLSMTESGLRVIFESGTMRELLSVCAFVFVLFFVRGMMSYFVPVISVRMSNAVVFEMRRDMIGHLMRLDLAYFERTKSGQIIQQIVGQPQQLGMFVGLSTANALRDLVTVVIVSAYLIWKSPLLFCSALVVLPFIIWIMNYVADRVKAAEEQIQTAISDYMNGIEEMTNGMRTVKISRQEPVEQSRMIAGTSMMRDLMIKAQTTQALLMPSIDLSSAFVYVLVIGGGGYMVLSPGFDIDGAGIITFLLGMVMIFDPARLLAQFFGGLQNNLVILGRIRQFYQEVPRINDAPDATAEFDTAADIVLKDIKFSYSEGQPLFDGLNLTFKGGRVSAIVGSTGSGKTTILSLMSRLYDVQGGQITIGDVPINKLKIAKLRDAFSVVAQDIVVFNNSIWENIRYVNPEATEEEVWQAAENAEIADLIRRRGDAPVGPKGAQLSGGQKQRIAIARAFLRDAPIILLDEATSALDQATEARIKTALDRLSKGKTTVVVAHRLSSVADADKVFVLETGDLVESGTHEELLNKNGLYSQLYQAQKQGYEKK